MNLALALAPHRWSDKVTHLVMDTLAESSILCSAIIQHTPIVSCEWVAQAAKPSSNDDILLPNELAYLPRNGAQVKLPLNPAKRKEMLAADRRGLFSDITFVVLSHDAFKQCDKLVALCGGVCNCKGHGEGTAT